MRKLFGILSASLFILSCADESVNLPDLQQVRSRHDKIIDSVKQQLTQDPLNRKLLVEFGKTCLSKSRFERELSWTGAWGTLVHPKLAEAPLVAALPPLESALQVDTTSADLYALLGRIYLGLCEIKRFWFYSEYRPLKDKAAKALSKALELDSLHVEAMINSTQLVPLYWWGARPSDERAKAEELAEKAIRLSPENGMAYFRYGQALAHFSDGLRSSSAESDEVYDKVIKAYRKAIKLGVDDASAYVQMAISLGGTGVSVPFDFNLFNKTFGFVPGFIKGFFLAGLSVMEMSGREKAGRLASKALQLNPVYPAALMILSSSFEEQGRREEAVEYFLKATQLNPSVGAPYYWMQESFLEEVISRDPQSYIAYARLGEGHLNRSDQSPISYIKKALEIRPDYAEGWLLLGRAYQKLNLIAEADTAYQKALSLPWDNTLNLYGAMSFYADQKKFDKVIAIVEREIAEGLRDSAWVFWEIGNIFDGKGELDKSILYYTRALGSTKDPRTKAGFFQSLASVYTKKKDFNKAILILRKVLSLVTLDKFQESDIYNQMGSVYSAQGNLRKAIESFERAIALNPDIAVWHYELGKELLKVRQKEKALEHFQRAAELGYKAARDSVQSLQKRK